MGRNTVEFSLASRPKGLECGVVLEYVELLVGYNIFPRPGAAKL